MRAVQDAACGCVRARLKGRIVLRRAGRGKAPVGACHLSPGEADHISELNAAIESLPLLVGPNADEADAHGLADPFPLNVNGKLLLFGTGRRFAEVHPDLTIAAPRMKSLEFDFGKTPGQGIWALNVVRDAKGGYHGYAALVREGHYTEICHFTPAAAGPDDDEGFPRRWRLERKLLEHEAGAPLSYDPHLFVDRDGALYLLYVSVDADERGHCLNGIYLRRLLDYGTFDPDFEARLILAPEGLRSEDRNFREGQLVEGPRLYCIGGKYILLYSVGDYESANYKLAYAWSETLAPPGSETYRKIREHDRLNLFMNSEPAIEVHYLLQSQERHWPNYVGEQVFGPGIGNLYHASDGRDWLIFHGRLAKLIRAGGRSQRYVWALPIRVQVGHEIPPARWLEVEIPPAWQAR